jgi:hypothetical protein
MKKPTPLITVVSVIAKAAERKRIKDIISTQLEEDKKDLVEIATRLHKRFRYKTPDDYTADASIHPEDAWVSFDFYDYIFLYEFKDDEVTVKRIDLADNPDAEYRTLKVVKLSTLDKP